MTIRLKYLLDKKDVEIKHFCEQNKIASYSQLAEYCKDKHIQCDVTQEEYKTLFPPEPTPAPVKSKVVSKNEKKATKTKESVPAAPRRRGRKSKTTKAGSANTKDNS